MCSLVQVVITCISYFSLLKIKNPTCDYPMNSLVSSYSAACAAVILFILRCLKDADFQPRIALVTRTVSNSISDLAHFFVLFGSVLIGYAVAGTILFGNQYDAFYNLSRSCLYILVMLIAFNPDEGWVQVRFFFCLKSVRLPNS